MTANGPYVNHWGQPDSGYDELRRKMDAEPDLGRRTDLLVAWMKAQPPIGTDPIVATTPPHVGWLGRIRRMVWGIVWRGATVVL